MQLLRPEAGSALFLSRMSLSINFAVSARVRGPLTRERLEVALAALGRRHPLLAVRAAARADGTPYFTDEGVPPIPLRVGKMAGNDEWVGEVERAIQQPTRYLEGPLLRCVWLRGEDVSDLILVCDHLNADGRAGVIALRDLLSLLADPSQAVEPVDSPPLPDLVPPEIVRLIREDTADLPAALQNAGPPPEEPRAKPRAEPAESDVPGDPVRVTPFCLDAAETSALVRRCRAEGVTVQAALCAAFLTPFAERQPDRPMRRAEIPVDLRGRLIRPVGDAYACMIGLTKIDFDCTPGRDLWDVARDAAKALAAMRDRDLFATPLVVITLTGRIPSAPWDIDYDLSVSNLGRLDIPASYGELHLESVYGPIFPATGPKHLILGISTFDGQMRCTYSSRGPDVPPSMTRGRELLRRMSA
jgi:hypothetical protein